MHETKQAPEKNHRIPLDQAPNKTIVVQVQDVANMLA